MLYPLKLEAAVVSIPWGGRRLVEEYGLKTDKANAAEAWMLSCTGDSLSLVANGKYKGKSLLSLYEDNPAILGKNGATFDKFPVLIKFIDARESLSVQVHPDDEYAEFVGEGAGKTEAWYILDCDEGAELVIGFKKRISEPEFLDAIEDGSLMDYVEKVKVKKGDFFFIEAGTLHAIGAGIVLAEVQQNSNTTYRVFDYNRVYDGQKRPLHVDDAVKVTKREPYNPSVLPSEPQALEGGGVRTELAQCEFFKMSVLDVEDSSQGVADETSFVSLLVLEGEGELKTQGENMPIKKGESVFLPAGLGEYEVLGRLKIMETRI
ncbi:MAG TPA: class I mannose-6-phosphate isomerase [Clostridiales bacterium]|jgi:mannose-6-phosphate isomerase|nr:class I mannose-6-phosphate isomerase [Clostridiales bacterium]HRT81915.1 class I mannose-6-phosphate isomerase [Oscillospiraceae bacterium]